MECIKECGSNEFNVVPGIECLGVTKFHLVKIADGYYEYGTLMELQSKIGVPVGQCGTKEQVMAHCLNRIKLCQKHIDSYTKEHDYARSDGWVQLVEHEQKRMEALEAIVSTLSEQN